MPCVLSWCYRRRWYTDLGIKIKSVNSRCLTTKLRSQTHQVEVQENVLQNSKVNKKVLGDLSPAYDCRYVESGWYKWWTSQGYFEVSQGADKKNETFSMVFPPPNVTGTLHLGHALTCSVQDAIVRWNRMRGKSVVWVPGSDHAGIATQVVVEKALWKEKKLSRHDIGRKAFVEEVWKWKNEKGDVITDQMKRLGSSFDWSKEVFTMDKKLSEAVLEAFIQLHDAGLIYRSTRIVNWSCSLQSAISDMEVENLEIEGKTKVPIPGYDRPVFFGVLTSFKYPVHNSDDSITVATTRPETMLGDVAIAVHPSDSRYQHLHGQYVVHPIDGRLLPIITDNFVDKEFGTGAVKITPAHDLVDFEVGKRHDLPFQTVIDTDGKMNNTTPEFNQKKRFDVRWMIVKKLKELGLYVDEKSHNMTIPLCSRSKDVVERLLKDQWYLDCTEMGKAAIQAVENKDLQILPKSYEKHFCKWLDTVMDWCISRQLWWGHRIPAYKVLFPQQPSETWVTGTSVLDAKLKVANKFQIPEEQVQVEQDEDVLDTWFSSALLPFSVYGWPNQTEDLSKYYPTDLLETGNDILYFWVARMVMLGLKLTEQVPFSQVLLHGTLRDAHGRKMSKSLGNVVDPLDVIQGLSLEELQQKLFTGNLDEKEIKKASESQRKQFPKGLPRCGADALRFTLCSYDFKAGEINMNINQVKSNHNFCNKIWQAYRYITDKLDPVDFIPDSTLLKQSKSMCSIDKWILSQLSRMVKSCDDNFHSYDLHQAAISIHHFWYSCFCDNYLEFTKEVFREGSEKEKLVTIQILYLCLDTFLHCISPFMPFITEELYQRLHTKGDKPVSICISPYPTVNDYEYHDAVVDNQMYCVDKVKTKILSVRTDYKLTKSRVPVYVKVNANELWWKDYELVLKVLSRSESVSMVTDLSTIPDKCSYSYIQEGLEIFVHVQDLYSEAVERKRYNKLVKIILDEMKSVDEEINSLKENWKGSENIRRKLIKNKEALLKEMKVAEEVLHKIN